MTSLDPITDHWLEQGGSDPGTQAWSDLRDDVASSQRLHGPSHNDHVNDDVDSDTRQALAEVKSRAVDKDDWDEAKPHREWLSERYPDTKLDDYAKNMLGWHDRFKRDPYGAKEDWVRSWVRMPPFHHKPKATAAKDSVPEGTRELDRVNFERDIDARDGYRRAVQEKADRDQYASTAELRQQIRQATGLSVAEFLDKCRAIDTASLDDPIAVANRFMAFNGAAVTERQLAEQQHQANAGAQIAQVQAGLDRVVASGRLPGLGTERVDNAVAEVLTDPRFERTGDHGTDLANAYHIAVQHLAAQQAPANAPTAAPENNPRLAEAKQAVEWQRTNNPKYAELEPVIAMVLDNPEFERTGVPFQDLGSAFAMADLMVQHGFKLPARASAEQIRQQAEAELASLKAELKSEGRAIAKQAARDAVERSRAADRARRASKSVSGSPSPGASSGQRGDDSNSAWDDAAAAYRASRANV